MARRLLRNKMALFGLLILLSVVAIAALYPEISPHKPTSISRDLLQGPSAKHLVGTDSVGRDLITRIAVAFRTDLVVTLAALALALAIGIPLGLVSGFYSKVVDNVIMRMLDIVMAFPVVVLAVAIIATMGKSTENVAIVIGLVFAPIFARIVRGQTLVLKNEEYV